MANVEIDPMIGEKCRVVGGGGCLSVPFQISTPRESRHSSADPMRPARTRRGFLAL